MFPARERGVDHDLHSAVAGHQLRHGRITPARALRHVGHVHLVETAVRAVFVGVHAISFYCGAFQADNRSAMKSAPRSMILAWLRRRSSYSWILGEDRFPPHRRWERWQRAWHREWVSLSRRCRRP